MNNNENFFNVNPIQSVQQNPFTGSNNLTEEPKSTNPNQNRLNGYDSTILNNKTMPDQKLSLEFKINEKQKALTDINGKIRNAELYGTQTEVLSLRVKKQRLEQELIELNRQNATGTKKSLTGEIIEIPLIKKAQTFFSRKVLAKVSKKFNSIVFLGDSLAQLSEINKSIDALMEMKVPYGEKNDNYEKLTEYLAKANKLHSKIAKTFAK